MPRLERKTVARRVQLPALLFLLTSILLGVAVRAQVCFETDAPETTHWAFYVTGGKENVRTFAGFQASNGTPMDGTFLVDSGDERVKVVWTSHNPLTDPDPSVSHFRCDLSVDTLEGDGEEIRIVVGQTEATVTPLLCRALSCSLSGLAEVDPRLALGLD